MCCGSNRALTTGGELADQIGGASGGPKITKHVAAGVSRPRPLHYPSRGDRLTDENGGATLLY